MLRAARIVLVTLNVLNWLCAAGFLVLVAWLSLRPDLMAWRFGPSAAAVTLFGQAGLLLGTATAAAVHVIFTRLMAIIDTAKAGTPFSHVNAGRLKVIAWALLATQVLDLAFGLLARVMETRIGRPLPWSFGLTGWLAVLMLFVLARVFARGTAMQDELEATV